MRLSRANRTNRETALNGGLNSCNADSVCSGNLNDDCTKALFLMVFYSISVALQSNICQYIIIVPNAYLLFRRWLDYPRHEVVTRCG